MKILSIQLGHVLTNKRKHTSSCACYVTIRLAVRESGQRPSNLWRSINRVLTGTSKACLLTCSPSATHVWNL
jgi:hypothetical protein